MDFLRAGMQAKAAGKQSVAIGNMDEIAGISARGCQSTSAAVAPYINVVLGISYDGLLASRTAGSMDAHQILNWNSKQSIRIIIPQILFISKWKLGNVIDRLDILWLYAHFIKFFPVKRHMLINMPNRLR